MLVIRSPTIIATRFFKSTEKLQIRKKTDKLIMIFDGQMHEILMSENEDD